MAPDASSDSHDDAQTSDAQTSDAQKSDAQKSNPEPPPRAGWLSRRGVRPLLFAFGWLNVLLGTIGLFVPLLPTTIFLIIALWAFSRSSERFHKWLYTHPRFGPPLRAWHTHGVIAARAKILAVSVMTASWLIVTVFMAEDWMIPALLALVLLPIAAFILTRPSVAPL